MRTIVFATALFLHPVSFASQSGPAPKECRAPSVRAFGKTVKAVLARAEKSGKNLQEAWSKDKIFMGWIGTPKTTLSAVDLYLSCTPYAPPAEVQLVISALQCLDLDTYLDFLRRLAKEPKGQVTESAMYYALSPGDRFSTRLATEHANPAVNAALKEVVNSPNLTPALQRMVIEMLDGTAAKAIKPGSPLLSCPTDK